MLADERTKIILDNIHLVGYIMKRHNYIYDEEADDLFQEGYLALIEAVDGFKSELGFKFSTYACMKIYYKIKLFKRYKSISMHGLKMDREVIKKYYKVLSACEKEGIDPSNYSEYLLLLKDLGLDGFNILSFKSCDDVVTNFDDGSSSSFSDFIPSGVDDYAESDFRHDLDSLMPKIKSRLSKVELSIVSCVLDDYLKNGSIENQVTYSKKIGVSQPVVSRALKKFKTMLYDSEVFR